MLFQNQIDQYRGYSERYNRFNAEFRNLVPNVKPKIDFGISASRAVNALKEFAKAFNRLKTADAEHQRFLKHIRIYLTEKEWNENAWLINRIAVEDYGRFENLICSKKGFDVPTALEILPDVKALWEEYLVDTVGFMYTRESFANIEKKINSTKPEDSGSEHN